MPAYCESVPLPESSKDKEAGSNLVTDTVSVQSVKYSKDLMKMRNSLTCLHTVSVHSVESSKGKEADNLVMT
ncbi:hypothetical protein AVEN_92782-1 [Araneus ventricosus]|uniref:Uncharacterized protein n=1 Tax=Araneus ventricosus TaxID=182803 RepID=A0A4Y2MC40_ARAVE|nr:hypothetical protein AVEN_92782-1 [Araneus ventricosus]